MALVSPGWRFATLAWTFLVYALLVHSDQRRQAVILGLRSRREEPREQGWLFLLVGLLVVGAAWPMPFGSLALIALLFLAGFDLAQRIAWRRWGRRTVDEETIARYRRRQGWEYLAVVTVPGGVLLGLAFNESLGAGIFLVVVLLAVPPALTALVYWARRLVLGVAARVGRSPPGPAP